MTAEARVPPVGARGETGSRKTSLHRPPPVTLLARVWPAEVPAALPQFELEPEDALVLVVCRDARGRAISGICLGVGEGGDLPLSNLAVRFLGPDAPASLDPPGDGPLYGFDSFAERFLFRLVINCRISVASQDPAVDLGACAHSFLPRKAGKWWARLFCEEVRGRRLVRYGRPPLVLTPDVAGIRCGWGPRRWAEPEDIDPTTGRQWEGSFVGLLRAAGALSGGDVDSLSTALRLFAVPVPSGPLTHETAPSWAEASRELLICLRRERDLWPGVRLDRLASAAGLASAIRLSAKVPQPLRRRRIRGATTFRVPPRAIGAAAEAAGIGARVGIGWRR